MEGLQRFENDTYFLSALWRGFRKGDDERAEEARKAALWSLKRR